jgi:hypothetical protein
MFLCIAKERFVNQLDCFVVSKKEELQIETNYQLVAYVGAGLFVGDTYVRPRESSHGR